MSKNDIIIWICNEERQKKCILETQKDAELWKIALNRISGMEFTSYLLLLKPWDINNNFWSK